MRRLVFQHIDITHDRLVELFQLADHAYPFYQWVEAQLQGVMASRLPLHDLLQEVDHTTLQSAIVACYQAEGQPNVPPLLDGVGRPYPHRKACYYFFAWLIRDAPQQRLSPLIQRISKTTKQPRLAVETAVLAALIVHYRPVVQYFQWEVVREVIATRLEGSRRSLKGHAREVIVRTALLTAIERYRVAHGDYGIYHAVQVLPSQVSVSQQTYDVSATLVGDSDQVVQILVAVKTRETEGGGHAHLFSRDVSSAIRAAKMQGGGRYLVVIIVARNWSAREVAELEQLVDHLAVIDLAPSQFTAFPDDEQQHLDTFIEAILSGHVAPKGNQ